MKRKSSQGGYRPGAGRKPIPEAERRRKVSVRLSPIVIEYLRDAGMTATIEGAILRSRGFREWKRGRE